MSKYTDFQDSIILSPDNLTKAQENLRSRRHADVLRVDLAFTLAAAETGGIDPDALDFMNELVEKVCDRAEKFEQQIIKDQIRLRTHVLDPAQVERDFQEYLREEREFNNYIHDAVMKMAPVAGSVEERDRVVPVIAALYDKIATAIDSSINPLVRQNEFDEARMDTLKLRAEHNPNDPLRRKEPIVLPHGSVGPGFLDRLVWPEADSGGEDRIYYTRDAEGLRRFATDIMNVMFRESVTYHPTEYKHGEAITAFVDDFEAKRAFLRAKTDEERQAAVAEIVARKQKVFDPSFNLIKVDAAGNIENETPVDETANNESPLMFRVLAFEEIYQTMWRFMEGAWGELITPDVLREVTMDYVLSYWGIVDIDGNYNKKSDEHGVAEGVKRHSEIMGHYVLRLREAAAANITVEPSDGGPPWLDRVEKAHQELLALHSDLLTHQSGGDLILLNKDYAQALDRFETILLTLGNGKTPEESAACFEKDLNQTYAKHVHTNPEGATKALLLSKLSHKFGWHGALLEYRQTAERHAEMIHHLLQIPMPGEEAFDYKGPAISESLPAAELERKKEEQYQKRKKFIDRKLREDPNFLYRRILEFRKISADADQHRNTRKPEAIAFHTDRTMQFFARFPHLAQRAMLAEYESSANYSDMIAIQNSCRAPKTGRSASLHVAPLLEKVTTLKKFREFYNEIVTNPTILKHLFGKEFNQSFMTAYSDNMKRFGITTRMAIDTMWSEIANHAETYCRENQGQIKAALKEAGIDVPAGEIVIRVLPDHGKSHLRPDHDGQYMLTAQMKEHSAPFVGHLGGKVLFDCTAQHHDNIVRTVADYHRHITRIFSEGSQLAAAHREGLKKHRAGASDELTSMVSEALENLQTAYDLHYSADGSPHCHALADTIVNNNVESKEGNPSSRATLRAGGTVAPNVYARGPDQDHTVPVSQADMRAITLANDQVHMGSRNAFLGVAGMMEELKKGFEKNPALKAELRKFVATHVDINAEAFDNEGNLTTAGLWTLALPAVMPRFRKQINEIGFGTKADLAGYAQRQDWAQKLGKPMTDMVRQDLENRQRDYLAGSEIALRCLGIDPARYEPANDEDVNTRLQRRAYLLKRMAMPLSTEELELPRMMGQLGTNLRDNYLIRTYLEGNDEGDRPRTESEALVLRILANQRCCIAAPNALTVHDYPYAARRMERLVEQEIGIEGSAAVPFRHVLLDHGRPMALTA